MFYRITGKRVPGGDNDMSSKYKTTRKIPKAY